MKEILMMRGARKILDTCLNVSKGEKALIVTDTDTMTVAKVLAAAFVERDIEPVTCVMLPREMDGQEPPTLSFDGEVVIKEGNILVKAA